MELSRIKGINEKREKDFARLGVNSAEAVSYTHLTLPTIA